MGKSPLSSWVHCFDYSNNRLARRQEFVMAACPLCVLGFEQPHSKDDWKQLAESDELLERWTEELKKSDSLYYERTEDEVE